jgi:hypothetical protein
MILDIIQHPQKLKLIEAHGGGNKQAKEVQFGCW